MAVAQRAEVKDVLAQCVEHRPDPVEGRAVAGPGSRDQLVVAQALLPRSEQGVLRASGSAFAILRRRSGAAVRA